MISIVLESPDFLIVDKPAGIATQPLRSQTSETLASLLSLRYPELKSIGESDWGAVHRLDRETSGLVVFARDEETYKKLRSAFSKGEVEKEYEALVEGVVTKSGRIEWPIGPDPKSTKRVKVYKSIKEARRWKALEAVTLYTPLTHSLLRIQIKTGRRHQIRAHLAAIGHPILGDKVYEGPSAERLFLHASRLRFRHPKGNQWVEASSPSPFV